MINNNRSITRTGRLHLVLLLVFNCLLNTSFAQNDTQEKIDSTRLLILATQDQEVMAKAYKQLGNYYMHLDTDSSIFYLHKSIEVSSRISDPTLTTTTYNELAFVYRELGQLDSSLFYIKKAFDLVEESEDPVGKARLQYSAALILKTKGQYDSAQFLLERNLQILEQVQNQMGLAVTYNALGQLAEHTSNYTLALDYYYKALLIYEELENEAGAAIIHNNIGIVFEGLEQFDEALTNYYKYYEFNKAAGDDYRTAIGLKNVGIILEKKGQLDSAISNYKAALRLDSLLKSNQSISYDLRGLGSIYLAKEDYAKAYNYFHRALRIAEDPIVIAPTLIGLGAIHLENNVIDSATYYLETALDRSKKANLRNDVKEAYRLLYSLHLKTENLENSFNYYQKYIALKDSLFNEKNTQEIASLKAGFEFEKERREQEVLKNLEINQAKSVRNIFIVGTSLFVVIAFLLLIIYRRKKVANERLNDLFETVKKQADELKTLDETKSRFYSNISHELRTPLTLISSPLEHILTHVDHSIEVKHHLKMMDRNTQLLKTLVDDILDLSKLESNTLESKKETIDLSNFSKLIFSNFESLAEHRGVNYRMDLESIEVSTIQIDRSKLEKILNNLLSNAFKYTSEGGEVSLLVKEVNNRLLFEVIDTGQGIEQEDLPFIFDRYYQSKQPDVSLQGGSGIGLALSNELAGALEGELTVTSEKGSGSTFTLSIPYEPVEEKSGFSLVSEEQDDDQETLHVDFESAPIQTGALPDILIVEDHPEMQSFIKGILSSLGNIHLANNGKQALAVLSDKKIDLIVSDIMMPEMDGYELLTAVRKVEAYGHIPFIMLTALKGESHLLKALSIGVDDYLIKPFSTNEIRARVLNMLERRESRLNFLQEESTSEADENTISDKDKEFIEQLEETLLAKLEDEEFNLKELADVFFISYRQLERKIKGITGLTPKQFQQEVAMQQARKLLEEGKYGNPTAIAFSVGIRHVTRFSNLYEKRFGKRPEKYFQ